MPDDRESEPAGDVKPESPVGAAAGGNPLDLPRPRSRVPLWIALVVIVLTVAGTLTVQWVRAHRFYEEWSRLGPLEPSGGLHFPTRLVIDTVPIFRQGDRRWHDDSLGTGRTSMAAEGCAVTSAAMVLASYGADTDPGRLNKALAENEGFERQNILIWEKAAEVTGNIARKAYEDLPSYQLIDQQLQNGNPVIVRLRNKSNTTHFVVIVGKEGYDYLIRDPSSHAGRDLYPLKEYGSKIEALRFYERIK